MSSGDRPFAGSSAVEIRPSHLYQNSPADLHPAHPNRKCDPFLSISRKILSGCNIPLVFELEWISNCPIELRMSSFVWMVSRQDPSHLAMRYLGINRFFGQVNDS
jgi:hypothetical protein